MRVSATSTVQVKRHLTRPRAPPSGHQSSIQHTDGWV